MYLYLQGAFDFAVVYSDDFEETDLPAGSSPCSRFQWGKHLMHKLSENSELTSGAKRLGRPLPPASPLPAKRSPMTSISTV